MDKIDFVIPWVDGNDEEWQKQKHQYTKIKIDNEDVRYRDWGTLQYWFRGVEQFAPWVNRIHLITWGHLPDWLNINHEKLHIVRHEDYIPKQYLPTFSCNPIELNMHRIAGLAERFVYFNDDMFIVNPISSEQFFQKGLPCDMAVLYPIVAGKDDMFAHILLNDAQFINHRMDFKEKIRAHSGKWLSPVYGKSLLKNLCMLPFPEMSGIMMHHQPQPYLKTTLEQVWESGAEVLDATCHHKFRTEQDVNQYIFRYWQLMHAQFVPSNRFKIGHYEEVGKEQKDYETLLCHTKYWLLCFNDVGNAVDFDMEREKMIQAFQKKFPQKSSFEK